jgi:phosphate uptake regulator
MAQVSDPSLFLGVRKIQKVGYSTYLVSLPKKWVEEMAVGRGDILSFREDAEGTLMVTPGLKRAIPNFSFKINADLCTLPGLLRRTITANYMVGHDTITVEGRKPLSKRHTEEIQDVCNRLTGVSVMEYGLKSVTLQSFVDPSRTSVYGLLRRLQIILSGMLTATADTIGGNQNRVDEVVKMEEEADRIYYMIVRQLFFVFSNIVMAKEMGIDNPRYIIGDRLIAKSLEEIADITTQAALEVNSLDRSKIRNAELLQKLSRFPRESQLLMEQAFESLVRGNTEGANQCAEKAKMLRQTGRSLTTNIRLTVNEPEQVSRLEYVAWNLLHISRYVEEIAEVAINHHMLSSNQLCTWEHAEDVHHLDSIRHSNGRQH